MVKVTALLAIVLMTLQIWKGGRGEGNCNGNTQPGLKLQGYFCVFTVHVTYPAFHVPSNISPKPICDVLCCRDCWELFPRAKLISRALLFWRTSRKGFPSLCLIMNSKYRLHCWSYNTKHSSVASTERSRLFMVYLNHFSLLCCAIKLPLTLSNPPTCRVLYLWHLSS
jgi:hypothetical protein